MTLIESVENVFSNYFNTEGRASRSEYWWWYLFTLLASTAVSVLGVILDKLMGITFASTILTWGFSILVLIPTICVQIRRYHDINRSGWWILCPIVNFIFLFFAGDEGENDYGLPQEATQEETAEQE
ncbi:MAG: DUF805 domain-containing protein [Paludibacteraceae bacterium]|jgi:uncharacterized membrane protein YhaH (DUF805 family)|nr:DUF805 domain-containing protein [Paludibacteraceae bacterium]